MGPRKAKSERKGSRAWLLGLELRGFARDRLGPEVEGKETSAKRYCKNENDDGQLKRETIR